MAVTAPIKKNKKRKAVIQTPAPVKIVDTEKPLPVVVESGKDDVIEGKYGKTLAPTTTEQEDIVTSGQRRINLIWEITQAIIAISVTYALIYTSVKTINAEELKNAFFLIIGFYFSRTNHTAMGGVGRKPMSYQPATRVIIGWMIITSVLVNMIVNH